MDTILYILAFIFILGSAVVLHEFGHFIVAKLLKFALKRFQSVLVRVFLEENGAIRTTVSQQFRLAAT